MDKSFPPISYAQCVKTNSTESKDVDLDTAPMSWYDQVESYQNSIMVSHCCCCCATFDRLICFRFNSGYSWKLEKLN